MLRRFAKRLIGMLGAFILFAVATIAQIAATGLPDGSPTELDWYLAPPNPWLLLTACLAGVSALTSVWQFFQPAPATKTELIDDNRKTRSGVSHVSKQVATEGRQSELRDKITHRLLTGNIVNGLLTAIEAGSLSDEDRQLLVIELSQSIERDAHTSGQMASSFAETVGALAQSSDQFDRSVAAEAIEGDPIQAAERLLSEAREGRRQGAMRAWQAAQLYAPFSVAKAIAAYEEAIQLDPISAGLWIELARIHEMRGSTAEARRCAEKASELATEPLTVAAAENELGDISVTEGEVDSAARHYLNSKNVYEELLKKQPDNSLLKRELSMAYLKQGRLAYDSGQLHEASNPLYAALDIRQKLFDANPNDIECKRDLAVVHSAVGNLHKSSRKIELARREYERQLELFQELVEAAPAERRFRRHLSVAHREMGDLEMLIGRADAARKHYLESLALDKALVDADPDRIQELQWLWTSYSSLGRLEMQENLSSSRDLYERALSTSDRMRRHDPNNPYWEANYAQTLGEIGILCAKEGNRSEAYRKLCESYNIFQRLRNTFPAVHEFMKGLLITISCFHKLGFPPPSGNGTSSSTG